MADETYDDLTRDLALLGRSIDPPAAADGLATAVLDRIAVLPLPAPETDRVPWRVRVRDLLESRRRRIALVVAAVLVALLATPPVRAAVADWFGFGGVVVEKSTPAPVPGLEFLGTGRERARLNVELVFKEN